MPAKENARYEEGIREGAAMAKRKRSAKGAKNTLAPTPENEELNEPMNEKEENDDEMGSGRCVCGKKKCKGGCSRAMKDGECGGMMKKPRTDALTPEDYTAASELGIQERSLAYIHARLDAIRTYSRDNNGRFARKGTGATGRGGRLKTGAGNKRKTQTMEGSKQKGVIGGKVKRNPAAAAQLAAKAPAAKPQATGKPKAGKALKYEKISPTRQSAQLPNGRRVNVSANRAAIVSATGELVTERKGFANITAAKKWAANPNARGPALMGGNFASEKSPRQSYAKAAKPKNTMAGRVARNPAAAGKLAAKSGRYVPVTNSKGQVTGIRDRDAKPATPEQVAASRRSGRAVANQQQAMKNEGDGPNSKASRKASTAKRAQAIYAGRIDPKAKTGARLTRTTDPEALRKRVAKIKDNNAAKAAAAKPAGKPRRPAITPAKVLAVTGRVNAVTANASNKTGVKKSNAIEVGVRAKAFLTRKAGGMSGMAGKSFEEQQGAVKAGLTKPTRYSTQKPNRNKPMNYNSLGQSEMRYRLQAAESINRYEGSAASPIARGIRAEVAKQAEVAQRGAAKSPNLKSRTAGPKAPNTPRVQANRLRTALGALKELRKTGFTPDETIYKKAVQKRNEALQQRTPGTPGRVSFRSRGQAIARQNYGAKALTKQTKILPGYKGLKEETNKANGTGIKISKTGMSQGSLFGGATELKKARVVPVQRKSGLRSR